MLLCQAGNVLNALVQRRQVDRKSTPKTIMTAATSSLIHGLTALTPTAGISVSHHGALAIALDVSCG